MRGDVERTVGDDWILGVGVDRTGPDRTADDLDGETERDGWETRLGADLGAIELRDGALTREGE